MKSVLRGIAVSIFALNLAGSALAAPNETVLQSFTGGGNGIQPYGSLIADSNGNLYGTTVSGGGSGNVFELSPPASAGGNWTVTVLYNFCSQPNCIDGTNPLAGLIADGKGNLYGTTAFNGFLNGTPGYGSVFELSPPAAPGGTWTETVLHAFTGGDDGGHPHSALIADSTGNLYGTATASGVLVARGGDIGGVYEFGAGPGVVFELSPPAAPGGTWTETVLHSFTGYPSDGAAPYAGLIADGKGNLYGTAFAGGSSNPGLGYGVVFELSPPAAPGGTWTETVLHSFSGYPGDGAAPYAGLTADSKGNLYGTTEYGGASGNCAASGYTGCGVVFELSPPAVAGGAWTETVLHSFTGTPSDGANPTAGLIIDNKGDLFGTAQKGGPSNVGVVFELAPPAAAGGTWTETLLYGFCSQSNCSDGAGPVASLIADSKSNLYGTAASGGTGGSGTVFELTGTGFVTNIPFAAFRSNLELQFGRRPNKDAFELQSEFTLGSTSTGFNLLTDPVTLNIGTYTAAIAPGSFRRERDGQYYFAGRIDGAELQAAIAQMGGKRFAFAAAAQKADLAGTANPVPVTLTIGNNTGTDSIRHPERGW